MPTPTRPPELRRKPRIACSRQVLDPKPTEGEAAKAGLLFVNMWGNRLVARMQASDDADMTKVLRL